jgi:UDP-4-amino-4,6-dideoxy-N-acetyl-beta-L-altrosamine N-acetyltransferase
MLNTEIYFEKLTHSKIELLRNWRNQEFVLEQMEFQQYISSEEQELWFKKIENSNSCEYYIFGSEKEDVGLVHLASIDFEDKSASVGLFIGNPRFIGTGIAFDASKFIINRAFEQLNLERLFAKVRNSNKPALQYNDFLGFKFYEIANRDFCIYLLEKR